MSELIEAQSTSTRGKPIVLFAIVGIVVVVLLLGGIMMLRAEAKTNKVALSSSAKPVTVVLAKAATYRPSRTYIGTLEPWVLADVGPQFVAAYVDTVLVRPGAVVRRGEVLATLDCKSTNAATQAIASQARAIDARQKAIADEAARKKALLDGGYIAESDVIQATARSDAELAQLQAERAKLASSTLEVNDCILRSPFDGEISRRAIDPGAFVRPGTSIVTAVDRSTIRMTADAPEVDFDVVAPETKVTIHILATGRDILATITRRAPAADASTRTVHFEVDLVDQQRQIPVGTTGEVHIDVGDPVPATEVPLYVATLRGAKASIFVLDGDVARQKTFIVKGEAQGQLYLETKLAPGTQVVAEGRALLEDGDKVTAKVGDDAPAPAPKGSQ